MTGPPTGLNEAVADLNRAADILRQVLDAVGPPPPAAPTVLNLPAGGGGSAAGTCRCLPVGIAEIAERLDVRRPTVDQWLQRDLLPPRDWTVGGRPAWSWDTIQAWATQTGRL